MTHRGDHVNNNYGQQQTTEDVVPSDSLGCEESDEPEVTGLASYGNEDILYGMCEKGSKRYQRSVGGVFAV